MNPIHLAVYIWLFLNNLVRDEFIEIPRIFLDLFNITENELIRGTLLITNLNVTGFETLISERDNIETWEDEDENNDVCVYIPVGFLKLSTDYVADIGIADEIPLYGEGRFEFSISDIDFRLCTFVSFDDGYVDNVNATLLYRHNPVTFTGFWRNEEATEIILKFLNIFNWLFAMWATYEPERASCILNPIIEYIFNNNLEYENNTLRFNTTCIQGLFTDILGDDKRLEAYVITALENYEDDDETMKSFIEENRYTVLVWTKYTVEYIRTMMAQYVFD